MKNIIIGAVAVAVIGTLTGIVLTALAPKTGTPSFGSYYPNGPQSGQGFAATYSTSSNIATTLFCSNNNQVWSNTVAVATATLPAATSTFAACPLSNGATVQGTIVNDSTNTIAYVVGTGVQILCEAQGVGTTTVVGGCTSSTFSINPTSTMQWSAYFDTSSTFRINVGNLYH